jgi:hypothetical protein
MRAALIAAGLLTVVAPVHAQTPSPAPAATDDLDMIVSMWTDSCPAGKGVPAGFATASSGPLTDLPACISIEGLRSGYRLFEDLDAWYRPHPYSSVMTAEDYHRELGIYGKPEDLARAPSRPTPTRLTGRPGSCGDSLFMGGYCHYFEGRYFMLGEAEVIGSTPVRRTGPTERQRLEQLREMPPGPLRDYVLGRATTWRDLVRGNDPAAYSKAFGDPSSTTSTILMMIYTGFSEPPGRCSPASGESGTLRLRKSGPSPNRPPILTTRLSIPRTFMPWSATDWDIGATTVGRSRHSTPTTTPAARTSA